MRRITRPLLLQLSALLACAAIAAAQDPQAAPQASFVEGSRTTLRLEVDGKPYFVDVAAGTVRPANGAAVSTGGGSSAGTDLFAQHCASCHGDDGRGKSSIGTPDFTNRQLQASLTDQQITDTIHNGKGGRMPAFGGQLSGEQISDLLAHVRSFSASTGPSSSNTRNPQVATKSDIYKPGDDMLFSLPSGRPVDKHAVIINFSHRFPFSAAFTGTPGSTGFAPQTSQAFGLDNFAISSLGVRYGVTDKFSVDVYRSPSLIGRPIQLMAAYNLLEERHENPFNLQVRVSLEGQDNFRKNYTENVEAIFSRSITSRMQVYVVPTLSVNDRRLLQGSLVSSGIVDTPGINTFSVGVGVAIDILPTVALIGEIIPTAVNGTELGIHRPPFSLAIQKKLFRHAFTFGVSTSPGTTVSQRAGTNATFLDNPSADTPAGLFLGFDLTRQIH